MSTGKTIGKNFIYLVSADLISRVLSFIIIVYIAKVLGDVAFGRYALAQSIIMYFNIFLDLGVVTLAIRELAKTKTQTLEHTTRVLSTRFLLTTVTTIFLVPLIYFLPLNSEVKLLTLLLGLASFFYFLDVTWVFSAHENMKINALLKVFQQVLFFVFSLILIFYLKSIEAVGFAYALSTIVMLIVLWKIFIGKFGLPKFSFNYKETKQLIISAFPIGYSALMVQVYYNLDTIILSWLRGDAVTGWYNAAYRLIFVLISLMIFLNTALLPVLSRFAHESKEVIQGFTQRIFFLILVLSLPLGVIGTLLSKFIITTLFGFQYVNAVFPLQVLIWAVIIYFNYSLFSNILIAYNQQKKVMVAVTLGTFTNFLLNIYLIPKYSLNGAAVATLVTEVIIASIIITSVRPYIKLENRLKILQVIMVAVIMAAILYLSTVNLLVKLIFGLTTYALIVLKLGIVDSNSLLGFFKDIVKKRNSSSPD